MELRLAQPLPLATVRTRLTTIGLGDNIIQSFDNPRDILIRTHVSQASATELSQRIARAQDPDGNRAPEIRRVDVVGPQIGAELRMQAMYAVLAALGGILLWSSGHRGRRRDARPYRRPRCSTSGPSASTGR